MALNRKEYGTPYNNMEKTRINTITMLVIFLRDILVALSANEAIIGCIIMVKTEAMERIIPIWAVL
jgi:hypothetical protein